MLTRARAKSASNNRISNQEQKLFKEESFNREMYNNTLKELKELNHENAKARSLHKNLYHQKKTLENDSEKIIAQLRDKHNNYSLIV